MSAARPNTWMPLYVGDYLRDTGRLSTEGHGAYLLLIMDYWSSGKPLPDDDAQLAAITKLTAKDWKRYRAILCQFFVVADGLWRHKRIDDEMMRWGEFMEQRRAAGIKSGEARRNKANIRSNGEATSVRTGRQHPFERGGNIRSHLVGVSLASPFEPSPSPRVSAAGRKGSDGLGDDPPFEEVE